MENARKKVDFPYFEFSLSLTLTVSVKKESKYDMKILVIFMTVARLVYRHAAGEYY